MSEPTSLGQSVATDEHTLTRYRTIVADPPWEYEPFVSINRTVGKWSERVEKPLPYESMTVDEIKRLPVGDLADPSGAFLWLWTTNRYLRDGFDVMGAWGFTYRQAIVWHKVNGTPFASSVAPNHAEFLLFGRRGNPTMTGRLETSVFSFRHNAKVHSRKPEGFIDRIEAVSPGPYAELFSRRARFGWDYPIGDQALGGRAA